MTECKINVMFVIFHVCKNKVALSVKSMALREMKNVVEMIGNVLKTKSKRDKERCNNNKIKYKLGIEQCESL